MSESRWESRFCDVVCAQRYYIQDLHVCETRAAVAFHADVLRGSSRVPAPLTSADLSGKKTKTNHSRLPDLGSALWTLRNFALDLAPEKIRKVSLKLLSNNDGDGYENIT